MKSKKKMSLPELLTQYEKACEPITDEYVEKRVREVFGNPEKLEKALSEKIAGAINSVCTAAN
jgi:hypothetical protein